MKTKNFFETDSFLQTQKEWNEKLKQSGFEDIELTENGEAEPFVRPQVFTTKKLRFQGGADYYELCQNILRVYDFKRDLDRLIFELHAEGLSVREIADRVQRRSYRSVSKSHISRLIKAVKDEYLRTQR